MAKYRVIIPIDLKPAPAGYEITAATLLAEYFKAGVEFITRSNRKTPDFLINGVSSGNLRVLPATANTTFSIK